MCYRSPVNRRFLYLTLRIFFGGVWFVNGLYCKVLGMVPRHGEIVAKILGEDWAAWALPAIGVGEMVLALLVWSGFRPKLLAAAQIALVLAMNVMESFLAPELLLWGRWNAAFALAFCVLIFANECTLGKPTEEVPAR